MKALERRVAALEGHGKFYTLGEMMDSLDGEPLPKGKSINPAIAAGLVAVPKWKPNHA